MTAPTHKGHETAPHDAEHRPQVAERDPHDAEHQPQNAQRDPGDAEHGPHDPVCTEPPSRAARSGGLTRRLVDRFVVTGSVLETERIAARMNRIRIGGEALRKLSSSPGQQVRVLVPDESGRGLRGRIGELRTYSVWSFDATAGELDLCVMDHGEGPGARWGRTTRPGDEVRFRAPEGSFTLRQDAPYHVFVGEETASVPLGAMLAAVPDDVRVYGVVETAAEADRLPLPRSAELTYAVRGNASAASSQVLPDALRRLELPDEPGVAYIAGEARTVQRARAVLVEERGWPRRSVVTKPFWTPGRTGMD
ncbi:siderophore-interacting protein [Yinghuangia seranimata]|uniref:siderophore-interacting protein n=1 Tax=Yinghuangia seranimata TaxID=408067 RepID=UPI00248A93CF|nr:siderophore-interacting protein [Yinghuangia seranimata]MDI2130090.1 siderophore-interacting protein [Yinghuangia seranimata]